MKYTIALVAFAAGALAESSSTITSAPSAPSASLSPQLSCVATCASGDVTCQAACLGIARPNASQAIDTNECAAKCDQGDGSPGATQKYADCQQSCFNSLFPSSQTAFAGGAGAAAGSASTASPAAGATNSVGSVVSSRTSSAASGATGASRSPSGSAAQPSASTAANAANANSVKMVGAGLAGFMAIFAL